MAATDKRRTGVQLLCAIVALSLASTILSFAERPDCPQELQGQYSSRGYSFSYQSWVARDSDLFLYCFCIRNKHQTRTTFFDWKGTGLASFLEPGEVAYSKQPFDTEDTISMSKDLFFGALPSKIQVDTRFHRPTVDRSDSETTLVRPVQFSQSAPLGCSPVLGGCRNGQLVSTARIFVPKNDVILRFRDRSLADMIQYIERTPGSLYSLRMTFTSYIDVNADGQSTIKHRCEWEAPQGIERPYIYAKINDAKLHKILIGTSDISGDLWTWTAGDEELSGEVPDTERSTIADKGARMDIVLSDRKTIVGSMPFSYYESKAP